MGAAEIAKRLNVSRGRVYWILAAQIQLDPHLQVEWRPNNQHAVANRRRAIAGERKTLKLLVNHAIRDRQRRAPFKKLMRA